MTFDPPRIETPPPVAPGSQTSELAASKVTNPIRVASYRKIFHVLAALEPLTREQLSAIAAMKESSLCARLSELAPTWIEVCGTAVAQSGCRVNLYRLTEAGRRRWQQANEPITRP